LELFLPLMVFGLVFAGILVVMRRSQHTVARLNRHEIAAGVGTTAPVAHARTPILADIRQSGSISKLAAKAYSEEVRSKTKKKLLQAGNPMPVATYLLIRAGFMFVLTPLALTQMYKDQGVSSSSVVFMTIMAFVIPNLPPTWLKRKVRKRERQIERALPDSLDLLVVCVEGGLSLDAGIQQVSQRTEGLLSNELRRAQGEISTGMSRRDALLSLAARSSSQSLSALCTTIVQADKMGVSISSTLRTLAETLRTRRRQAAETQARKAPIKMLPFIVFFMLPSLFIVILGPVAVGLMQMFNNTGSN
jgi:tight adherence protein C